MADKTIYSLPQIEEIISEQKYKFCNVTDLTGETIVPYNSIKTPISKKLAEIKLRLKRLPDGVYCITCKSVFGTNNKGDKYYFGKGKQPKTLSEEQTPVTIAQPVTQSKKDKSSEQLLSLENFTENMKELSELRGEVIGLKAEVTRLKKENEELNAELDEEPEEISEGEGLKGFGGIMKDVMLSAEPILDRYFNVEERKLRLAETKLLADKGYEIPGAKKLNGAGKVKAIGQGTQEPVQLPAINGEGYDEYIEHLLQLPEEKFNAHLEQLKALDEEYYNAVCADVFDEEPEEEK